MSEEYNHDVKITKVTDWDLVYKLALDTAGLKPKTPQPTDTWKRKILQARHSPIRGLVFVVEFTVPYWVSVHFVRHKIGVEHFVQSQRVDRTGEERDSKPQDAPVRHTMLLNAEAIMNISAKRLCRKASPETRDAWNAVLDKLHDIEPVLVKECGPQCYYNGGICREMRSCRLDDIDD